MGKNVMTFEQYCTNFDNGTIDEGLGTAVKKIGTAISRGMDAMDSGVVSKAIERNFLTYAANALKNPSILKQYGIEGATKEDFVEGFEKLQDVGYKRHKITDPMLKGIANYLWEKGYNSASATSHGTTAPPAH